MALSKLCKIVRLSPNCSRPRNHAIDRLTYHHMAGRLTAESCLDLFANRGRQASSNYVIGYDGTIGGCVDEGNRPWTSSSRENDNRAITFELSNSSTGGNWPVSDATIQAAIDLTVDICKRHGKTKVIWFGDKDKSLAYEPKANEMVVTVHHWFANTNCPGPYLESKLPYIVSEVNKRIGQEEIDMTKDEVIKLIDERIAAKLKGVATEPSSWAKDELAEAVEMGITDGQRPRGYATREEAAIMVLRSKEGEK